MQEDVGATDVVAAANFLNQVIAIQLRHLDVRHQQLEGHAGLLVIMQLLQRRLGAAHGRAIQTQLAQDVERLLQGNLGIVDDQYAPALQQLRVLLLQQLANRCFFYWRRDVVQHLLDIEHLNDAVFELRDAGNEGATARAGRWWAHVAGRALHDALDVLHMQALTRAAQLGDDQAAVIFAVAATLADGAGQVDHRNRRATQRGDPQDIGVTAGQLGQGRTRDDLVDLEQVDPEQPAAMQTKQQ